MKLTRWMKDRYIDLTFWVLYIILIVIAVIALFSAGSTLVFEQRSALGPIGSQMFFLAVGVVVAFGIQFLPSWLVRGSGYLILAFSILCLYLILLLGPGHPLVVTFNGASRWMRLAGIVFQPSEIAKLGLIIVVADMLARIHTEEDKRKYFLWTLAVTAVTVFPILTGNFSTAALLTGIVVLMWILARVPWKYILSVIGAALVLVVIGYCIVEFLYVRPHRPMGGPLARAVTWVNRVDDMLAGMREDETEFVLNDDNYQSSIAKVAIARGGKSPIGVLPGNSEERNFLPLAFADYIFAIMVEETGAIGALLLMALYMAILFRACFVSSRYADYAAMLMVMGLALMITCQALVSMLVAVGLGPVTGQPLPLISRGGTSAVITSVYFGIILCVSREQAALRERQNQTERDSHDNATEITFEE